MGQVISQSADLKLKLEEEVKEITFELIQSAKMALASPNDDTALNEWDRVKKASIAVIKKFLFASSLKTGANSVLRRSSWNTLMVAGGTSSTGSTPSKSLTTPKEQPIEISKETPTPPSTPVKNVTIIEPKESNLITHATALVGSQNSVNTNAATGSLTKSGSGSTVTATTLSNSNSSNNNNNNIRNSTPFTDSQSTYGSYGSSVQSSRRSSIDPFEKVKADVAIRIIKHLHESFAGFRSDWQAMSSEQVDGHLTAITMQFTPLLDYLSSHLPPASPNSSPTMANEFEGIPNEDDEELGQLKKIINLQSAKDWQKMSRELKSLTRKLEKKSRKETSGKHNFLKDWFVPGSSSANLQPEGSSGMGDNEATGEFKGICHACGELVTELVATVGDVVWTMAGKGVGNRGNDDLRNDPQSWQNLNSSVSKVVTSLLENLRIIVRVGQNVANNRKEKLTKKPSKKINEVTEDIQDKFKHWVLNFVNQTIGLAENCASRGKPDKSMINAISESEVESVEGGISTRSKMEELLQRRIESECEMMRVLAIQLMSTLTAMSAENDSSQFSTVIQLCSITRAILDNIENMLNAFETYHYISNPKFMPSASTSSLKDALTSTPRKGRKPSKSSSSVWKDRTQLIMNHDEIVGGTLNQIIKHLTSSTNPNFLTTFISTYQSFTTPWTLLEKLEQRYNGSKKAKVDPQEMLRIKLRVCVVLKYWIDNQFFDFDSALIQKVSTFINETIKKDSLSQMAEMAQRLSAEISRKTQEQTLRIAKTNRMSTFQKFSIDLKIPEGNYSPIDLLMRFSDTEIARQMTLLEFTIFKQIKASELLNQAWNSQKLQHKAPNIKNLISRANKISFWVASLIVWHSRVSERAKIIEKFIKVAEHLRFLNNFNSLIAIIAGLNVSAISRLKFTWENVEKSANESLKKLQTIFDPSNSYKTYRAAKNDATSKGPVMPYIGVTLSDLTFAEDGNPDHLQNDSTLINFAKREVVCKIILELQLNQQQAFSNISVVEPVHTFLRDLPHCNEKELYDLSLLREPRGATSAQVQK